MSALTPEGVDIEIDGNVITFSPLTFADIEWLELRLRARAIEAGRLSIPSDVGPAERERLMDEILAHANKIDLLKSFQSLFTASGIVLLLYRAACRTKTVNVTLDMAQAWANSPEFHDKIKPIIALLAGRKKSPAKAPVKKPKK